MDLYWIPDTGVSRDMKESEGVCQREITFGDNEYCGDMKWMSLKWCNIVKL